MVSYNWIEHFNKGLKTTGNTTNEMTEDKDIWSVPVSAIFPLVLTYYRQGECQNKKNKKYTRLCSVLVSYALLNSKLYMYAQRKTTLT